MTQHKVTLMRQCQANSLVVGVVLDVTDDNVSAIVFCRTFLLLLSETIGFVFVYVLRSRV